MKRARSLAIVAAFFAVSALATPSDPRGWSPGTPAANSARVLEPLAQEVTLEFPSRFQKLITGPTVIVYFSPTCPHCQAVAPEINALSKRLGESATVIGVSTGGQSAVAMKEFVSEYRVPYKVIHDTDGEIAATLGVDSTPSVMLVVPDGEKVKVADYWYPYRHGFDTLVEMRALENPWEAFRPGEFHGDGACATCHLSEASSALLTHHSIAWATLVEKEEDQNPACTNCHVTGAGQPTGWDGSEGSHLVNVGCEACHGPGGPHDGARLDPRTTCSGCHDEKHSIAFSVEKGLPKIDHYRADAMDDNAFFEERRKLANGEVPRDLLAFSEGTNVGSAACVGCHSEEHGAWEASPHAKAMARLDATQSQDPTCVRCHATAERSGPPPATVAEFHTSESVGCESCHGPGEAHVKAGGGKGNIEGLGEDCPVCVLEAVCTSCHTPQWDPNWELEPMLEKIKHGKKP